MPSPTTYPRLFLLFLGSKCSMRDGQCHRMRAKKVGNGENAENCEKKTLFWMKNRNFSYFYWKNRNFSYYLVKKSKNVIIFDEIYSKKSQFLPFLVVFIVKTRKLYDFDRKIQEFERFLTKKNCFQVTKKLKLKLQNVKESLTPGNLKCSKAVVELLLSKEFWWF